MIYIPIGKQWYQLHEFILSNLDSSLCMWSFVSSTLLSQQPPLSSVVKSRRLSLCLDMSLEWMSWSDANRILFAQPPDNWRRPCSREVTFHLESKCLQRPVLIWHGADRGQGGSSELTFLADVNEARHYALLVVHARIGLDTSAFSALTLLVEHQEEHMALRPVKNCMMRCWCGCLEV